MTDFSTAVLDLKARKACHVIDSGLVAVYEKELIVYTSFDKITGKKLSMWAKPYIERRKNSRTLSRIGFNRI